MLCHNRGYDINVARVINLKLAFRDWFFYDLILVKLCEIRYLNLCKALLFPRNQVICLKDWKLWRTPTTIKTNIFCWNFAHVSYFLLFLNQFIITSDSDCKVFFNSVTVFAAADKELSSAKLCIDALETKKNKSFIEKLNRIGPVMEPWGTPEIIFWKSLFLSFIRTHWFRFVRYEKI